jgi:hypothetical protein
VCDVDAQRGGGGGRRSVDFDLVEGEIAEGLALGDLTHDVDLGDAGREALQLRLGDLAGRALQLEPELVSAMA